MLYLTGDHISFANHPRARGVHDPVAPYADMHPAQIMRAIQLGQVDLAVEARFIWLCIGCQTCTTRCRKE